LKFFEKYLFFYFKLVTESFRDFCKKETLTGENLYDAGSIHGLQVGLNFNKTLFFFFLEI
jgi:hypothetical protein